MNLHHLAEERSIAYHRAVAVRLLADPALLERARERIRAWLLSGEIHLEYGQAWARVLELPVADVAREIASPSESARALRQTTPFAGFVSPRERWAIWRDVRHALDSAEP